ncbi:MAG: hypothetical protein KJ964_13195 [Verrucomicrobia bacterium]|nr:hypothetical protein [Verrucomicrobiota bacterium]MBU1735568.1 hypothetical protein [Verrucomicrobiota bacterium]MBU1856551.1 hypothetical protein [Verrucomicrobiota bacterium]
MSNSKDVSVIESKLYFLPVHTRVPLKFGPETVTRVTCARTKLIVKDSKGRKAEGWGETPLSVTWVWPSSLGYEERHEVLKNFTTRLAKAWAGYPVSGHPMEIGYHFIEKELPKLTKDFNKNRPAKAQIPHLAALVCNSLFDIALHDAYGNLHRVLVYKTYNKQYMNKDLSAFITPAKGMDVRFKGKYPADFLIANPPKQLLAWHLIGGVDLLDKSELTGKEPKDGYPVVLTDWIKRDSLKCLKVKLRGNDPVWDYDRLVKAGKIALKQNVDWLTTDFNCTVTNPAYVNDILDRLMHEYPRIYAMILYVEQPFPYDLEKNRIDVHSVSARKPLFMDESAHDWRMIKLGRSLGWTGVALKTCKTQTGAILSACWAKAHGMTLMVQDLTNPMLAQIPHVLLAAHAGTIAGVETNSMQFYPQASKPEEKVHPGLYKRRRGMVDFKTLGKTGFGYCLDKIKRTLPKQVCQGVVTLK